jgi:hypothetical protein
MAKTEEERGVALRILSAAQAPRYQEQRDLAAAQLGRHVYLSPMRPFWVGFDREAEADAGFVGYLGELRLVETRRAASVAFLNRFELLPASPEAMRAVASELVASRVSVALSHGAERRMAVAWRTGGAVTVAEFDVSEPGSPAPIGSRSADSLDLALVAMAQGGYSREVPDRYVGRYLGSAIEAQRVLAELAEIRRGDHPGYAGLSDAVANADSFLWSYAQSEPDMAAEVAGDWLASPGEHSARSGLSPERVGQLGSQLVSLLENRKLQQAEPAAAPVERKPEEGRSMSKKQKWIDLAEHGIYLGDQRMADGKHRLVVLDMQDRGDPARLREIGFLPVVGSPRYDKGIYYLHGDDQRLRPKALAAAFGIESCPLVEVEPAEIDRVFREKITEKFGANLNALTMRSRPLGQNRAGQYVYESPAGRFIRLSSDNAVAEGSQQAAKLGRPAFLRASDDEELRACAEGFLWTIRQGGKTAWPDLVRFAKTVYGKHARDGEPSDDQLHHLQEAVEAASYRRFTALASKPDEAAFRLATDFYYGLPTARMRTAESVFLQQYSTPLPMSVIAQRLLVGNDDLTGKSALEPTAGNGGLVNLLPEAVRVFGVELDANRFAALRETGRIQPHLGDATEVGFRRVFGMEQGFDYTIANPPFGQMDAPKAFDKIPNVRKLDLYIPLRALEARKDAGRSVVIFGADSAQSDGTIKGGAKAFLNYIHDHYEVHGMTEVDGRLYARHGAGFNVRLLVIGDKRPEPIQAEVPEKLPIITSYDDLWQWAGHVIERYDAPKPEPVKKQIAEPSVSASALGGVEPVFDAGAAAVRTAEQDEGPAADAIAEDDVLSGLPHPVRDRLGFALTGLRDIYARLENVERARGKGHILALEVRDVQEGIEQRRAVLAEFRELAPQNGVDAERVIAALGGEPDLSVFGEPAAVEASEQDAALPEQGGPVKSGSEQSEPRAPGTANQTGVVESGAAQPASGAGQSEPWQMTLQAWNSEVSASRAGSGIGVPTRNSGSEAAARFKRLEFLKYGVTDWASEKLAAAQRGEVKLTQEELAEITDRLETPVTHRDVIDKALAEGKPVPQAVLSDYPDLSAPAERHVNEFQAPYQAASRIGEPTAMVPINMAGATYAALNDLESRFGGIDKYVAGKLRYDEEELSRYFSPEQVDAIGLAIKAVEEGRGIINADQTGMGKGRFVAAMLRYAKLNEKMPVFLTIKPELFTDIFRDISDIGSQHLFKKLFIFNDGESVKRFGTENEVLYRATTPQERKAALTSGAVEPDTDMVLATYSQFMRAYHKNPKAALLTEIAANNGMLILDEAHVASGASNLSATVGQAVANSDAVLYASATPLKGVSNFAIYNKIFPDSVDLRTLPDTLKAGGEALQEAISTNMARDGVLIRREHDFSKLTFHTRNPDAARRQRNVELADALSDIIGEMSYLAGDVSKAVSDMNKGYKKNWEEIPEKDRQGARMQASSMNFGSRLYSLNRQFLLGIKIEDAVETALNDLSNGRKPVIAVENTGESLLRQVISRRAGIEHLEAELTELDERAGALSEEEKARRDVLVSSINDAMRNVVLDEPPQYRELLESMLDRIGVIKIQGRYGDVQRIKPESEEYQEAEDRVREKIRAFPDLPLTPIDVVKKELQQRGHPVAEVSGRTASITPNAANPAMWDVNFHAKADAVANVAGFQNGKYDAIVITRSGSTGISLHATDRFEDSDIRQRDFIVLQKAANIAEFLQWMGRVNRKDQVVPPVITGLESGLPAELRLTMMHNAKLRKLSANTTSNRENANLEGEEFDLLNDVGDRVALEWLAENPDVAELLDINLPSEDDLDDAARFSQECPYINKLMGRLMMVSVEKQEEILKTLTERFADKIEELEQRGENPFKVDVFEWKAKIVKEEELQSGVIRSAGSTFDEPVKLVTVRYEQDIFPIRSEKLLGMVKAGLELYRAEPAVDERGSLRSFREQLEGMRDGWVRRQLPTKLRESEEPLSVLLDGKDVAGAKGAKERADWLLTNLDAFRPGVRLTHEDPFKGERKGVITSVELPKDKEDFFLLSKYRAKVAFPGEDRVREITLATVRTQGKDLFSGSWISLDPDKMATMPHIKRQAEQVMAEFDAAPDGKVIRTQYVLQGNIFRACELASKQKLGSPILFTDEEGNRQRAVLLKDRITPDMVKALPIGLDARDICDYIDEYLDPKHPEFRQRSMYGSFRIYDAGVKDMKKGEGIMFEVLNGGDAFRLSIPGTKSRAGALMTDGTIFDIGQKTPEGSLRLKLSGTKSYMQVDVDRDDLRSLMELMQRNHHVGKFYVPEPDHDVIKALKERFRLEHGRNLEVATDDGPAP